MKHLKLSLIYINNYMYNMFTYICYVLLYIGKYHFLVYALVREHPKLMMSFSNKFFVSGWVGMKIIQELLTHSGRQAVISVKCLTI